MHDEAYFNLKDVVKQTGVKPDTLRAWERRYGLPGPGRSEGGHRLYSRRDIETVKWLLGRQEEGLSISRAADLWHQTVAAGRDPLATPVTPALPVGGETLSDLRAGWITACLNYDERKAEQMVAQAFALYPPELVAIGLLQKAVSEIGAGWYQGEVTVQQEHFCSGLAIRRLESLIMGSPAPTRPGRILVAAPPQEQHAIGLLLLTFLLRRRGWEVLYLGSNVPTDRLEMMVRAAQPQLVILAAQLLHTAASLLEMAHVLRQAGVALAYGGLVFNLVPALRERIPGYFLGEQLEQVPSVVESLMLAPVPATRERPVGQEYALAREHWQERAPLVEAEMAHALGELAIPHRYLALANREMQLNVDAALALGDMDYLGTDLEWVIGLLAHQGLTAELVHDYVRLYCRAVEKHLDEQGAPVVDWLCRVAQEQPSGR